MPSRIDVVVDETLIQPTDERYWPNTAIDHDTDRLLNARRFPTRTQMHTEMFLSELYKKHFTDDTVSLVD